MSQSGRGGWLSRMPSSWNTTPCSGIPYLQAPTSFEDGILQPPAWWSWAQSRSLLGAASTYTVVPL